MKRSKRKRLPSIPSLKRKADKALSKYVLAHAKSQWVYKCPVCQVRPIKVCAHLISRKRTIIRWNSSNVYPCCGPCNWQERYYPDISRAWFIQNWGVNRYLDLVKVSRNKFEPTRRYLEALIRNYTARLLSLRNTP